MTPVSNDEAAREHLLMNLRLSEGIDLDTYEKRWNTSLDGEKVAALVEQGLLSLENNRLTATPAGRLLLNRVIGELV